ncbi:hypothetical protein EX30DRAFT_353001 [Ascodesmis nigricans]|uniref:Uncharacterized protein n=1 Tax=Ascodesmis nigricans TaxID=341454 RepID=A0A4V3SJN5_9PEZI|nr:hypothetical protein EX30DRAFT_353001 [Ascodesmis nigricans]
MRAFLRRGDFTVILRAMRPKEFMNVAVRHILTKKGDVVFLSEEEQIQRFYGRLTFITNRMQRFNIRFSLLDYFYLMETARAGGYVSMAERIWNTIAGDTHLPYRRGPDTYITNSYMAARAGTGRTDRLVRTSSRTVELRRQSDRDPLQQTRLIIDNMKRKGIPPNSMTWELMILAAARMGELPVIEAVLQKVWHVNCSELILADVKGEEVPVVLERESESEKKLDRGHPLYPSEITLFNIAVALGTIGQVPLAFRLVDYMSRRFEITVPRPAWIALLNWTYTWLHTRSYPGRKFLAPNAVENVWNTLLSEPYNIEPTIEMYDLVIRSYLHRGMPDAAEYNMDRALSLIVPIVEKRNAAEAELAALEAQHPEVHKRTSEVQRVISKKSQRLAKAMRDLEIARAIARRWVEILVIGNDMQQMPYFAWKRVPDIIDKWSYFLGDEVVYFTSTGYVDLSLGEDKRWVPIMLRKRRAKKPIGSGSKEEDDLF